MSLLRIISDPHFHHRNMAIKRGFKDEIEMNEHIISQWNKVVKKRDITWILGDITMEKNDYEILNRLNGIKKIILGNHDLPQHVPSLLKYVNSVCSMYKLGSKEFKGNIILTHCPIHTCEIDRFKVNIHGHVHENSVLKHPSLSDYLGELDNRYINVSAEVIDYTPKLLTELKQ